MSVEPDRIGPVDATVHRIRTADDVELAITRLSVAGDGPSGTPVVLVPGTFCQRSFWISPRGIGLGPFLRDRGHDVWIVELRGHGLSPKDRRFRRWSAEDHLRHDLPAVQALVEAESRQPAHWVGHSWGGTAIVGSMAGGWLDQARVRSACVLGANITEGDEWMTRRLPRAAAWLVLTALGRVPARLFRLGPEAESRAYILEFYRWKGPEPCWETRGGRSYWDGVRGIRVPLLAFAAAADTNDPWPGCRELFDQVGSRGKEFVLLGEEQGFSHDYQHVEMIIGKAARDEVWPRIADWIEAGGSAEAAVLDLQR
jgi:pimeloyl-ACP methyl ester carboxylesterase